MSTEADRKDIAAALAKAQLDMQNPKFDAQNPHFRNRYASLAAVRDAVVPVLAKHGISLTQDLRTSSGEISCVTVLTHSSGQQMLFGPLNLPVSKQDAQGYGSAATYARRYALMAVAGVVGDADDDAESAVGRDDKHDGKPDGWTRQDTKRVQESADRLMVAINEGKDIRDLWNEVKEDEAFATAVWTKLPKPVRDHIKNELKAAA